MRRFFDFSTIRCTGSKNWVEWKLPITLHSGSGTSHSEPRSNHFELVSESICDDKPSSILLNAIVCLFVIISLIVLNLTHGSNAYASKSSKRCSEWGAQDGKDCNGDPMYDYPITRGKIMAVGNDPFNMQYRIYMSACYAPWYFASDNCLYDFPGGDSHTFAGGKNIPTYNSKDKLDCSQYINGWSSGCVYRVNINGDKPAHYYGTSYGTDVNATAFICGFVVPSGFAGVFSSGDLRPVGCVPEPLLPGPPTFNRVIIGSSSPVVVQPKGDMTSWFSGIGSTFDSPAVQLIRDTDNQVITLEYDFGKGQSSQTCRSFQGEAVYYCPSINLSHPDQICAYKAGNLNGVPQQEDIPDQADVLGCIDRPGVEQGSNAVFMSGYRTFIANDGSMYQSIVPLVVSGAKKGETIGKDGTDDIMIASNYSLYKASNLSTFAECNLLENIKLGSDNNRSDNGKAKGCTLNSGVNVSVADYGIDLSVYGADPGITASYHPLNVGTQAIREYVLFKTIDANSNMCVKSANYQAKPPKPKVNYLAQYIKDSATMHQYNIKLSAIIPNISNLSPQYAIIVPPPPSSDPSVAPKLSNCSQYRIASYTESGAVAYISSTSSNGSVTNRDNKYCNCAGSGQSPDEYLCPQNDNYIPVANDSCCSCQVCNGGDPVLTQLVCPGVYSGPSSTVMRDQICFYSTNLNWDFITGKKNKASDDSVSSALTPSLICSPMPKTCAATDDIFNGITGYNPGNSPNGRITSNYPVPNLGNAAWPAGTVIDNDENNPTNGTCANNFTYGYNYTFDESKIDIKKYAADHNIDEDTVKKNLASAKNDFDNAMTQNGNYLTKSNIASSTNLQAFKESIACPKLQPQAKCIGGVYKLVPVLDTTSGSKMEISCIPATDKNSRGATQYTACDPSAQQPSP